MHYSSLFLQLITLIKLWVIESLLRLGFINILMNINVNFITNIHISINMNEIFIQNIRQYNNIQLTFLLTYFTQYE